MTDTTLVIGDSHVEPSQSLARFEWLGRYIKDTKPTRVVSIGDFLTLDSLSHWDKDKRRVVEGRRFHKEIEAGIKAIALLDLKNIPFIYIEGNHEDWCNQYVDRYPEVENLISVKRALAPYYSQWVPYKQDYKHKGVSFTHVPIMENGRPVSGKAGIHRALDIYHNSVVFGHTHHLATACVARHNSPHLNQAVNVGCFFQHIPDYAKGSVTSYWSGIVHLTHVTNNRVDMQTVSLSQLKREYDDGDSE